MLLLGCFGRNGGGGVNRFSFEYILHSENLESESHPEHIYSPLLPSSGFTNLGDIRSYLSRYYTTRFLDEIFDARQAPFVEYEGVLYILDARAGFMRSNWHTAIHTPIELNDNYTIVKTSVLHGAWHMFPEIPHNADREKILQEMEGFNEIHYFVTFENGRIDNKNSENPYFVWTAFGFLWRDYWE